MNFNDACFRFSQELARSFMLSSSRHPFLSQLFRRTGGNMLLLQSERALMFVPWLFLTWMFCAFTEDFKVTGAEGGLGELNSLLDFIEQFRNSGISCVLFISHMVH